MTKTEVLRAVRARNLLRSGEARRIRIAAGATQVDMANALGVERAAVEHWESGLRRPRSKVAAELCELLDELARITAGGAA